MSLGLLGFIKGVKALKLLQQNKEELLALKDKDIELYNMIINLDGALDTFIDNYNTVGVTDDRVKNLEAWLQRLDNTVVNLDGKIGRVELLDGLWIDPMCGVFEDGMTAMIPMASVFEAIVWVHYILLGTTGTFPSTYSWEVGDFSDYQGETTFTSVIEAYVNMIMGKIGNIHESFPVSGGNAHSVIDLCMELYQQIGLQNYPDDFLWLDTPDGKVKIQSVAEGLLYLSGKLDMLSGADTQVIGDINSINLDPADRATIVAAINAIINTINNIQGVQNATSSNIGTALLTSGDTNLTDGINNVYSRTVSLYNIIGALANLSTSDKTSIVNAINELKTLLSNVAVDWSNIANKPGLVLQTTVGVLTSLSTADKTSIVAAINELKASIAGSGGGSSIIQVNKPGVGVGSSFTIDMGNTNNILTLQVYKLVSDPDNIVTANSFTTAGASNLTYDVGNVVVGASKTVLISTKDCPITKQADYDSGLGIFKFKSANIDVSAYKKVSSIAEVYDETIL